MILVELFLFSPALLSVAGHGIAVYDPVSTKHENFLPACFASYPRWPRSQQLSLEGSCTSLCGFILVPGPNSYCNSSKFSLQTCILSSMQPALQGLIPFFACLSIAGNFSHYCENEQWEQVSSFTEIFHTFHYPSTE